MALTVKEQIVAAIAATIANVSGIVNVQRLHRAGVGASFADVPCVVLTQGDDVLEQMQSAPYTRRRVELVASICTRDQGDGDIRSGDEVLNALGGDVETALMADRQVGGLAEEVKPPEYLEVVIEEPGTIGVALRFAVIYRHLRVDPTRSE